MSKLSALHLILTSALPAPPTLFSIGAPCFRVPPRTGPRKTGVMGRRETRVDDKPHVVYIYIYLKQPYMRERRGQFLQSRTL